jgi:hypothetical protein
MLRPLLTFYWLRRLRDLAPESIDGHLARLVIEDCADLESLRLLGCL